MIHAEWITLTGRACLAGVQQNFHLRCIQLLVAVLANPVARFHLKIIMIPALDAKSKHQWIPTTASQTVKLSFRSDTDLRALRPVCIRLLSRIHPSSSIFGNKEPGIL